MLFSPHPKPDPFFPGRNSGGGRRQWRQRWPFYPRLLYPSVPSIVFLSKNKQHHHLLLSFSAFSGGNRQRTAVNSFGVRWVLLVLLVLRVIFFPFQLRFPYSSFLFVIQFGQPPWWPISGHFPDYGELWRGKHVWNWTQVTLLCRILPLFLRFGWDWEKGRVRVWLWGWIIDWTYGYASNFYVFEKNWTLFELYMSLYVRILLDLIFILALSLFLVWITIHRTYVCDSLFKMKLISV